MTRISTNTCLNTHSSLEELGFFFFALFCDVSRSPFEQTNAKSSVELGKAAKFSTDSECL